MCFNRKKQKEAEMRLQYDLFYAKTAHLCIQQTNEQQSATIKINFVIIVKKFSSSKNESDEKEFYDEKMLIKIRVVHQKIDFFARKVSWKPSLKQSTRVLKNKKFKKITLPTMKNFRNENYFDAMNLANKVVFNKEFKSDYIFNTNIAMKEVSVVINSNSRVVKYRKVKQIKFNSIEVIEISKRFKRLTQIIKEQFDFVDVIK